MLDPGCQLLSFSSGLTLRARTLRVRPRTFPKIRMRHNPAPPAVETPSTVLLSTLQPCRDILGSKKAPHHIRDANHRAVDAAIKGYSGNDES